MIRKLADPIYGKFIGACDAQLMSKLRAFLADESGATAIEYGLIAAGISVAIIAVVNGLGTKLNTTFSNITSKMK
jgi:pilus assembly protein Flp/PilA